MKRILLAALVAIFSLGAASVSFDPREPITVDLKDARITDVVQTLGALANLPVVIDPGIEGRMTLQMEDVPFEQALSIISQNVGLFLRVEEGKLVASRSATALFTAANLPGQFRDAARIPVTEYSQAFSGLPRIILRTRWEGIESCYELDFRERTPPSVLVSVGPAGRGSMLRVTQFGYEPVSKWRYLAVEGQQFRSSLGLGPAHGAYVEDTDEPRYVEFSNLKNPGEECASPEQHRSSRDKTIGLRLEVRERAGGNAGDVLIDNRIQMETGQSFSVRSQIFDENASHRREVVVDGYVSKDGRFVTAALIANATWTDPRDGAEYVFAQPSSTRVDFHPLKSEGATVTSLAPGIATPRTLVLRIFLDDEKRGAAE
ncbi:MAG: hypothetical protein ACRD1P_04390 [Thermoanaerobaculia bacterium]